MPDQPSISKRPPKLRSSCDACGMAKLRCDRAQPECGRCVSFGLPCVYGVSRRMGKAPGGGRRTSVSQRQSGRTESDRHSNSNSNSNSTTTTNDDNGDSDAVMMDFNFLSSLADIPTSFEMVSGNTDALIDSYFHSSSSLVNIASSFDFDSKPVAAADDYSYESIPPNFQTGLTTCTQESPELGDYASTSASTTQPVTIHHIQADETLQSERELSVSAGVAGHHCYMDAYEILRSLSLLKISRDHHQHSSKSTKTEIATENTNNWVPFDHVLRINRETSEHLSSLLACSCARSSHLTLLHASIICRVLTLYQQAAACTQGGGGLWNPINMTPLDPSSHYLSPTRSSPDPSVSASWGTGSSTTWPGTTTTTNTSSSSDGGGGAKPSATTVTAQSNSLTVTPAKMTVGVFNVDDQRVQTAINIQLVLGEMRRTERLIDQFTSRDFSASGGGHQHLEDEESAFCGGAVDNLCRSLDSWLRAEHSRIVNIMRLQLRKVNT